MNLSKKIFFNGIATIVNTASGLIRNKIFAVYLSINLFGILSIGQQSVSLLFTLFAMGIPLGITTLSSELVALPKSEQSKRASQIMFLSFMIGGIISVLLGLGLLLFPLKFSQVITGSDTYVAPISIMLFAVPFMLIEICLYSIMEGMGKLKKIVIFRIIPSIIVLPLVYFLSHQYNIIGASWSVLLNEVMLAIVAIILLRDLIVINKESFQFSEVFIKIFKVALLSFGVGVSWLVTDFFVKRFVLELAGETSNGIVQSVAKVTDLYPNLALSWLAMHLFPVLGERKSEKPFVAATIERTVTVALTLIIPVIIVSFAFRPQILSIIYKQEFTQASFYFGAMLITGTLKVFSWVIGVSLLPIGLKRKWFYSSLLYTAIYFAIALIALNGKLSFYGIPLGLGISLAVQSVYVLYQFKKSGIFFSKQFFIQIAWYSLITLLLMFALFSNYILILAVLTYLVFIMRYGLLNEIKEKLFLLFR